MQLINRNTIHPVEAHRESDLRGWLRHLTAGHSAVVGHIGLFQVSMAKGFALLHLGHKLTASLGDGKNT